ncbi:peptidase S8 [Virgisporangium aliadipatigenens]|uniref:Peptidase S8 n=1 Tax=Virgisporangium aliadipatigenens TaxID=741659 RepID=A0A8J4DVK0_9ACTN|nr:S8 family serine peptidase [Virgisporangium aliadipatigenens]GIJ50202.1 peptidase S8 [Virgisporangium aliadipatigenens]
MHRTRVLRGALALAVLLPAAILVSAAPSAGQADSRFTLDKALAPAERVRSAKPLTSRLARSDENLLARRDSRPAQVVVKLDYDPVATYAGGLPGHPATSPGVTGRKLSGGPDEQAYERYIAQREEAFLGELRRAVPGAQPGRTLRTVYGGIALTAPADTLRTLAGLPGVVAVQPDEMRAPLTDSSAEFIGAAGTPDAPSATDAGAGVIVGVLDTGAWPEHPAYADRPDSQPAPLKADGTARACDFGDNPLTEADDPFVCNRKLIGGQAFLETYLSNPLQVAAEKYRTARDSNGHGTHTSTTAAGNPTERATVLGTERGPLRGVASGAWISVYKVCGESGCFSSDSSAAVGQAVRDGVQVINYSVSGGTMPFVDPVELAFLDAYAAGVFVATSAGNEGPDAGTVNHLAPWVTTVAASTQKREFNATLTVQAGEETKTFDGASITGAAEEAPLVLAESVEGYSALCGTPATAGAFDGKIVACERGGGIARVDKGNNVKQGGAVGMVLYNPDLQDVETDNHWLPTVHLPDGREFKEFMAAHPDGVKASFTAGEKRDGRGDVMAAFSSRGPAGSFVKPDITAPGVQILAGHTPTPQATSGGPPGEYYQAIAGTSMSSPHVAGAAAWLKAVHPEWTPGRIRSALMTTATTDVVKHDLTTPADPFDMGAGRIRLDLARTVGLVFDETPARMVTMGLDPVDAVHLNLPSVNAPILPGRLTTVRTATNVTGRTLAYRTEATAPDGSSIVVRPESVTVLPGRAAEVSITIQSNAAKQQYFGEVRLVPVDDATGPALHLPVAFTPQQGPVSLKSVCAPERIKVDGTSTCTVTASNTSFEDATVDLTTMTDRNLPIVNASGAMITGDHQVEVRGRRLPGAVPAKPTLTAGQLYGYVSLDEYEVEPEAVGDEEILNFDLPEPVTYGGQTYTRVGAASNGYLVVGGGDIADVQCCDLTALPDKARPNNVLAPFWTDLDGAGAPGIAMGVLTGIDGGKWLVAEWRVNVYGTADLRTFQAWLRLGGPEEIGFAYPDTARPVNPGIPFLIGAENVNGTAGAQLPIGEVPAGDLLVTSSAPTPGASLTYQVTVKGAAAGDWTAFHRMDTAQVPGVTTTTNRIRVGK